MDPHFLEFWGNFLVNASKEQRRLKDLYEWMQQGFNGFDDLTEMFRKFYGLDHMEKDTPAYLETMKKASENFLESFKDYLDLMGMVPKDKHLALVQKYEALKEKVADQEETIKNLQLLLEEKRAESQGELVQGFQDLIEKQSKQYQKTMETFGSFFKKENNQ
jgi:tetratricopeptide (TPR) repeat protein